MAEALGMRALPRHKASTPVCRTPHALHTVVHRGKARNRGQTLGERVSPAGRQPHLVSSLPGVLPRITCSSFLSRSAAFPSCPLPFPPPHPYPTPQEVNHPFDLSQTPARTSVAARCSAVKAAVVKSPPRPDPTDAEEAAISVKPSVDLFMTPTAMAFPAKRLLSRSRTTSDGAYTQRTIVHSHTSGYLGSRGHQISPSASESARVRRLPHRTAGLSRGSPEAQTGETTTPRKGARSNEQFVAVCACACTRLCDMRAGALPPSVVGHCCPGRRCSVS